MSINFCPRSVNFTLRLTWSLNSVYKETWPSNICYITPHQLYDYNTAQFKKLLTHDFGELSCLFTQPGAHSGNINAGLWISRGRQLKWLLVPHVCHQSADESVIVMAIRSRGGSTSAVATLRADRSRNRASIPGRSTTSRSFLPDSYQNSLREGKAAGVWYRLEKIKSAWSHTSTSPYTHHGAFLIFVVY